MEFIFVILTIYYMKATNLVLGFKHAYENIVIMFKTTGNFQEPLSKSVFLTKKPIETGSRVRIRSNSDVTNLSVFVLENNCPFNHFTSNQLLT